MVYKRMRITPHQTPQGDSPHFRHKTTLPSGEFTDKTEAKKTNKDHESKYPTELTKILPIRLGRIMQTYNKYVNVYCLYP